MVPSSMLLLQNAVIKTNTIHYTKLFPVYQPLCLLMCMLRLDLRVYFLLQKEQTKPDSGPLSIIVWSEALFVMVGLMKLFIVAEFRFSASIFREKTENFHIIIWKKIFKSFHINNNLFITIDPYNIYIYVCAPISYKLLWGTYIPTSNLKYRVCIDIEFLGHKILHFIQVKNI